MATRKKSTARVTLRTVLQHMDRKFEVVDARFVSIEKEMKKEFKGVHEKMDTGFKEVYEKIDAVERRLTRQIDGIDERLDDVEIKEIPRLKKAVAAR